MKKLPSVFTLILAVFTTPLEAENIVFPEDAGVANVKTDYGAKGDGITDDTEPVKKAMEENRMRPIYFPNGTYLLSDSVGIFDGKAHSRSRFLQLQGQSEAGTILKLKDGSPGFNDPTKPKVFVSTYQGQSTGDAMFTNARNLTIDTGRGNPGAAGFRYMTNNFGTMENMTIRSGDGTGAIGLDLSQSQNGPCLVRNITVVGFDTGIYSKNSFSLVLEHITLKNQNKVGYHNEVSRSTVRDLKVQGAPVAVLQGKQAELTLIEGDFKTSAGIGPAIILEETPFLFLRDTKQSGYQGLVKNPKGVDLTGASVDEWSPLSGARLFGDPATAKTLHLPIEETPVVPWEEDLDKWQRVEWGENGDVSETFQAAIDSAATAGKTTVYLPKVRDKGKGEYKITRPIRVHGSVNRIIGMNNMLAIPKEAAANFGENQALFTFEDLKSNIFVIEHFFQIGGWDRPNVLAFDNKSKATIVVRNLNITLPAKAANPGGLWFFEDFSPGRHRPLEIGKGERIYCRQYNPESSETVMIHADGGLFWCLGLKTEGRATHAIAENGAQVEILGGVSYQSWGGQKLDPPMFLIDNAALSFSLGFYSYKLPFSIYVKETSGGQTKELPRQEVRTKFLPVFRSAK